MRHALPRRDVMIASAVALAGFAYVKASQQSLPAVPEVDIATAKALIDAGALVIDARERDGFDYRHLPTAMWIPLNVLEAGIPAVLAAAKAQPIVVYCSDGAYTGPAATRVLLDHGYAQAVNLKAGIGGWDKAGMPVVRGTA